jgi:hypothetical protein
MDQGVRHLCMGGVQNSTERLPGYIHSRSRVFLIQALQICQADRFELIDG